jgi:predicted PurR-regulated permease PerM
MAPLFAIIRYALLETFFCIPILPKTTYAYLPKKIADKTSEISKLTATTFTRYVAFQMLEAVILGSLCFIGMLIFGFSYPLLISIMIAVTALIPVVGAYIGCVFSLLLLVMVSPIKAMWFILFFIVLQQFEGNVIYPRVVGRSIGLPGILVLLAVIIGGSILGFPGMILGVPIMSILYTILKQSVAERLSKRKNS